MLNNLSEKPWRFSWILAVLFSMFTLYPTLENNWVNWDDEGYVLQNTLVTSLNSEGIQAIFSEPNIVGNYHPFTVMSLAVDYAIDGFNPTVYHTHNLLLHLCNVLLVFLLIYKLWRNYRMAFLVAILFGIHPLHVESLAWISARKDVLYCFYLLTGLLLYLRFINSKVQRKRFLYYGLCILFLIFSLLSKSMAIVFPVYLLLIDYLKNRAFTKKLVFEKLPFLLLSFLFVCITFYTQNLEGSLVQDSYLSIFQRITIASTSALLYAVRSFVPTSLSPFHPYPFQTTENFPSLYFLSLLAFPLLLVLLKYAKNRIWLFGTLFFLVSLLPVLQLIPIGRAMMAERYTYLAYIGLFILFAFGVELIVKQISLSTTKILGIGIALFLLLLASIAKRQSAVWKNGNTLWTAVIQQYPDNYFGYYSRADYFVKSGNSTAALKDINQSIQLYPHYSESLNLRGKLLLKQGQTKAAIADFKKAIETEPSFKTPYLNISQALGKENRYSEALAFLNQAIEQFPDYSSAYLNRGVILEKLSQAQQALESYSTAIELEPNNGTYYRYRGVYYLVHQQTEFAISDLSQAIKILQNDGLSYFLRAKAYEQKGRYAKALNDALKAKQLNYQVEDVFIEEMKSKRT
ncbi:MAG: tetratricopeptide repeat protein [Flavobacteriales bacterium]|nr:tetratricopeptide repeat protein [Flavobacteriales bacterium]